MKKNPCQAYLICAIIFGFFMSPLWGQESRINFSDSHSIDWTRGEIFSQVSYDLSAAGIRLPTGRFMAEEALREAYPRIIRTFLLSVRLDSNSTVKDALENGGISLGELDALCVDAKKVPPSLSPDLTRISGRYTVLMEKLSSLFIRHRRPISPVIPLIPVPVADYTGVIIIADSELPIQGRRGRAKLEPCLFPKIWDTDMTLVYERNMFDPGLKEERRMIRYAVSENIFRETPSGLNEELLAFVGPNPLRILARGGFGITPTDPIIDREDALKILSSENNRRLLREGRVALILNEEMLK